MSTSSPFDEPSDKQASGDEVHPALRRKRRPWWRWNLITLAVALFALIWLRELVGFELSLVWMLVLTVVFVWGFGPAFFVPCWLNTMAARADAEEGLQLRPWSGNLPIVVLKVVAVVLGAMSLAHLAVAVYSVASPGSTQFFGGGASLIIWLMQVSWVLVMPVIEFLLSASLFVLAEIALRLEKR